jgi:UDP-glucose 4-epimerase
MADKRVVAISGVAGTWGTLVAKKLTLQPEFHVIGIDIERPETDIDGLDFIQADIRNPLLTELLKNEEVDTFCHLAFIDTYRPSETAFEANVMGTVKAFGACVEASVRKIIIKSSTTVYGARATNPGFLLEDSPLRGSRRYGFTRDMVEIEAFCNGFRRQHPQIELTILRYPNIIGPDIQTPMTDFLSSQLTPILLGFDPMLQFIHSQDVVASIVHSVLSDHPGVYNIAATGLLPLLKVLGMVGKIPLPVVHLFAYWGLKAAGSAAQRYWPIEPDYLRFRWIADTGRMQEYLKFMPAYTAEEAIREFTGELRTRKYVPEAVDLSYDEERLRDTIERRRRSREAAAHQIIEKSTSRRKKV